MKEQEIDLLIWGAGLTGLTLAYYLRTLDLNVHIVDARARIGGRIHTRITNEGTPLEMGATWLGNKHSHLVGLLNELGITTFEQIIGDQAIYEAISTSPPYLAKLPPNPEPSQRIKGGSMQLIKVLTKHIPSNNIHLDQAVLSIEKTGPKLRTICKGKEFSSTYVVSTLPPNLLVNSIDFSPELPASIYHLAQHTHTWMGESIKIGLTYKSPFWRAEHLSGTLMSNVGPIPEMYDHSNYEDSLFALKGFLNGNYFSLTKEERLALILNQLQKYYGQEARNYLSYEEKIWRKDAFTYEPYDAHVLPHQNNGHPNYQTSFFENQFFIAGSETAQQHPGYMEGAIWSAKMTALKLESLIEE